MKIINKMMKKKDGMLLNKKKNSFKKMQMTMKKMKKLTLMNTD